MSGERYTVEELATATGHSVRNIRYYTGLGLVPAPTKEGRVAVYGAQQRACLELITALQEHGFTLEAVGRYLEDRAVGRTPEDLALQRAMVTSWTTGSTAEIQANIGRELRRLGLPRDTLAASHEATTRHMDQLAIELDDILRSQVVDKGASDNTAALRELTLQAVVVAFQDAMNKAITRSLTPPA